VDSMLVRKNVWSYLVLVALPLAAARCGGGDDDSGTGGAGTRGGSAGAAGKGTAGRAGSSGRGGAGKGGSSSNQGGEAGDTGSGGSSGKGGMTNAAAGESGASGSGGSSGTGGSNHNGGGTNGGEAGASAGESSVGGEGGAPACSQYPFVTCSGTLSNVGTGDFEIDFLLTTTQSEQASVLDQRPGCGAGASMWSVRMSDGKLYFESDDDDAAEDHYAICWSETAVNDGSSHWISYRRVGQELRMYIDCQLETTCPTPASLGGSLPTVNVGHGVCDLPVESGGDGTHQLVGTVENECVGKP